MVSVGPVALVTLEGPVPVVGSRGAFLSVVFCLVALQDTMGYATVVQMSTSKVVGEVLGKAVVPLVVAAVLDYLLTLFFCLRTIREISCDGLNFLRACKFCHTAHTQNVRSLPADNVLSYVLED